MNTMGVYIYRSGGLDGCFSIVFWILHIWMLYITGQVSDYMDYTWIALISTYGTWFCMVIYITVYIYMVLDNITYMVHNYI